MSWYFYVLIGVALVAAVSLVQRSLLSGQGKHHVDPYAFMALSLFASAVLVFSYRQFTVGYTLPDLSAAPVNIAINIAVSTVGTLMMFEALKRMEASRYIIISSLRPLFTLLASLIFIGTVPTTIQLVGGALIVAGTFLVYARRHAWRAPSNGLYFALLSAILLGGTLVNDKMLMGHYSVLDYLPFAWLLAAVLMVLLRPRVVGKFKSIVTPRNFVLFLLSVVLASMATVCVMFGVQAASQPASVSMIQQLQTVLVVLLGIFLLKEKENIRRKLMAAPLACCGVLLIVFA